MEIIGHRGARGLAPMNTKAAILAGLNAKADWIELDAHRTKDGAVVLSHDRNTFRVARKPLIVSMATLASLQKLGSRKGEPIITITEAFKTIGAKARINIDIKSKGCAEIIVDHIQRMIKAGASYDRFLVSSFKIERLREVHRLNARIPLGLIQAGRPYRFLKVRALHLSAICLWRGKMPKKAIEQAKIRGMKVFVYTVNSAKLAAKLQAKGVDGIITDRPDTMRAFLANNP